MIKLILAIAAGVLLALILFPLLGPLALIAIGVAVIIGLILQLSALTELLKDSSFGEKIFIVVFFGIVFIIVGIMESSAALAIIGLVLFFASILVYILTKMAKAGNEAEKKKYRKPLIAVIVVALLPAIGVGAFSAIRSSQHERHKYDGSDQYIAALLDVAEPYGVTDFTFDSISKDNVYVYGYKSSSKYCYVESSDFANLNAEDMFNLLTDFDEIMKNQNFTVGTTNVEYLELVIKSGGSEYTLGWHSLEKDGTTIYEVESN